MNRFILFICLCIVPSFANEQYQCYISHDANVASWSPLNAGDLSGYHQNCDSFGYVPLVKNDYVFYKMMISGAQLEEAEFYFYNGFGSEAVCLLLIMNDEIYPSESSQCQNEGIRWSKQVYGSDLFFKIDYIKANFSTTLRKMNSPCDDGRYYDIYIWQPKYLVDQSTGVCKVNDIDCRATSRSASVNSEFGQMIGRQICEPLPLSTTTTTTTTTTAVPTSTFKCSIYESVYVETWFPAIYPISQSSKPSRSCYGSSSTFQLIKNDYIEYILRTDGSSIQQLTLHFFDPKSTQLICNISAVNTNIRSQYCDQYGLAPTVIQTATYLTWTIKYPEANFTTNVTIDISVFIGRFIIDNYLEPELSSQSKGICDSNEPCTTTDIST